MICLSCTESSLDADLRLISDNRKYIDMAEIRVDFLEPDQYALLSEFPVRTELPCILTFRLPEDGGVNTDITVSERAQILTGAIRGGWAFLDIEYDSDTEAELRLISAAESTGKRIIKSFHDFTGVPEDLVRKMADISCGDRFIPKAAVMPKSTQDFIRIAEAFRGLEELKEKSAGYSCTNGPFLSDYILVGMGAYGLPTRIMAEAWGGMLTFSSAGKIKAAPGHISPEMLVETYNYRNLGRSTTLYGIIGQPVMHTRSPELHNPGLRKNGIDGVYLPFETDAPGVLLGNADLLNLKGLSVTVPHKQRVIELTDSRDDSVEKIGACNTLVHDDGWKGFNTDWKGFLKPLEGDRLQGENALVIGAGGAARAIVYALSVAGMHITVINRTAEKAIKLAESFGCRGGGFDLIEGARSTDAAESGAERFRLVVQTTSLGMEPDIEGNPVPGFDFSGVDTAYDIIYTPEETRFLAEARSAGCRTINGFPMLRAQAEEQFRLFTGCEMD